MNVFCILISGNKKDVTQNDGNLERYILRRIIKKNDGTEI